MITPALVLLAGGASSRMGTDKLRLRDATGRLLILQWFERLNWPTLPTVVLPPDGNAPEALGSWPVIHDRVAGEGPLRGIATVLERTTAAWHLFVAVDTPGVGRAQLDFLVARQTADPAGTLWMLRHGGRIEPFPLLIHATMEDAVHRRLSEGRRSVHGLADETAARVIDAPADWPADVWRNLNRPDELAAYLGRAV